MRQSRTVFLGGWLSLVLTATGLCAGRLTWEKTTVEVAVAPGDQDVVADFPFNNVSNLPVTISSVEASCDCTMIELAQKRYEPGERGKVRVRLEVGDLAGRIERSVSVVTDEPGQSPTQLRLIAKIPEFLRIEPKSVRWKVGGGTTEQIVTCTALPGRKVRLSAAKSNDPNVSVRLEVVEAGHVYRLHLQPRTTVGYVAATCELSGEVAGLGPRVFHAYAYVNGP